MSEGTYGKLAERFPAEAHKTRKQGGQDLVYVTGEMVISRLNEALGVTGWSWRVVREGMTDVEAWVLGELTATIDGQTITRQHYGNQDVKRGQHGVADLFKAANTDAIKKAATTIGVALYLYDEDERREVQAEMREQARSGNRPQTPKPTQEPTPITAKAAPEPSKSCAGCQVVVPEAGSVTILKKKEGPKVTVSVVDFAPVCQERLGAFYCASCYDKRYWGAA